MKGAWFSTARAQLLERYGEECVARVLARMPDDTRGAFADPMSGSWYPEVCLRDAFRAVSEEVFDGDPVAFEEFIETCALAGVRRFFRALIAITSPAFFIGKLPTVFRQVRRGSPNATVDLSGDRAIIHMSDLPFSDDPLYRHAACASLRALVSLAASRRPAVSVTGYSATSIDIEIVFA